MASKSHDLTARVILQGQVDNSFTQIGAQLENLGQQLLRTNRWVINFGKESLDAFVDFDDAMRDARYAMEHNYEGTASQFESDMEKMRKNAMDFAAGSIYSTLEIGTAYSKAAHAGKDFVESDYLVGAAINLAESSGMDLADAMDSLIVIMNAAGLSMEDAYDVVDQLVFGGNLAATTVSEITEAMVRMGPSLKFFSGDMATATAMLGVFADNGMTGAEAGTAMRMVMLRMIAPTAKASEQMAFLGLSAEEYAAYMEEAGTISEDTMNILGKYHFHVYDQYGNIRDMTEIWGEFAAILSQMSEREATQVLTDIFGNRRAVAAKSLVDDSAKLAENYANIRDNSEDAAEEARSIMQGGIGGEFRRVEATENALQTRVGSFIADDIMPFLTTLEDVLKWLYKLDDGTIGALTGFFETIAGAGAGLVVAGAGMKLIGTAIGAIAGGKYMLAAVGISALWVAIQEFAEGAKNDMFGDVELTMSTFADTFERIANAYDGKYEDIALYNAAFDTLIENYKTASQTFTQGLWDMLINGSGMSAEDWAASEKQAVGAMETMLTAGEQAVEQAYGIAKNVADVNAAEDDTGIWASIQNYIDEGYKNIMSDVTEKGIAVRKALLSAWDDGELTPEEIANIQSTLEDYNKVLADIAETKQKGALALSLHDNQTISASSLKNIYQSLGTDRDASIAAIDERWAYEIGLAMAGGATILSPEVQAIIAKRNEEIAGTKMMTGANMFDYFKTGVLTNYGYTDFGQLMKSYEDEFLDSYLVDFVDAIGADVLQMMALTDDDARLALDRYNTYKNLELAESQAMAGGNPAAGSWARLTTSVTLEPETSELDKKIEALQSDGVHIPVFMDLPSDGSSGLYTPKGKNYKYGYAEGGRADRASIFGEAGPEWAIPEEHSSRTAELLRMAAEASGFTWGELLSRNGGLNAGGGQPVTVVYSPTINANDASGVREELIADKSRLEKWFRERELKESLVSYA